MHVRRSGGILFKHIWGVFMSSLNVQNSWLEEMNNYVHQKDRVEPAFSIGSSCHGAL